MAWDFLKKIVGKKEEEKKAPLIPVQRHAHAPEKPAAPAAEKPVPAPKGAPAPVKEKAPSEKTDAELAVGDQPLIELHGLRQLALQHVQIRQRAHRRQIALMRDEPLVGGDRLLQLGRKRRFQDRPARRRAPKGLPFEAQRGGESAIGLGRDGEAAGEQLVSEIQVKMVDANPLKRFTYNLFLPVGHKIADMKFDGKTPGLFWKILHGIAYLVLFRPLKDRLGLSKVRFAVTGSSVLSLDTFRLIHAIGVELRRETATFHVPVGDASLSHAIRKLSDALQADADVPRTDQLELVLDTPETGAIEATEMIAFEDHSDPQELESVDFEPPRVLRRMVD